MGTIKGGALIRDKVEDCEATREEVEFVSYIPLFVGDF